MYVKFTLTVKEKNYRILWNLILSSFELKMWQLTAVLFVRFHPPLPPPCHTHTQTSTRIRVHKKDTQQSSHTHTHIHTLIHTHTYIDTHTYIKHHIHTNIHIFIYHLIWITVNSFKISLTHTHALHTTQSCWKTDKSFHGYNQKFVKWKS